MKYYILSGQTDAKQLDWWKDIRTGLKKSLVKRNTSDKEMPVMMIELSSSGRQINKMGHLGMFDTKNKTYDQLTILSMLCWWILGSFIKTA